MAIPLTPTIIYGMIGLLGLIGTMIFGMLMKKGPIYFKMHRIFSVITIITALVHAYLVLSKFF